MKICVDCKHFYRPIWACTHPCNTVTDLVSGNQVCIIKVKDMRKSTGVCGEEGRLFEPRPIPVKPEKPKGFWAKLKEEFFTIIRRNNGDA